MAIDDWKLFALALNLSFLVGFLIEWKDYVFCLLVVKKLYLGVSTLFSPLFSCYFFTELEPIMAIKIVTDATLEADVLKATRPFILAVGATYRKEPLIGLLFENLNPGSPLSGLSCFRFTISLC